MGKSRNESGKLNQCYILLFNKMELPPDILAIIREYTRPCFKYFREYKSMLRLCAFDEWTALREALKFNPEKVLPSLRAHEKAQTLWLNTYHENLEREEKIRRGYLRILEARGRTFRMLVNNVTLCASINEHWRCWDETLL